VDGYGTEKEQLEAIRKWWSENGTWLLVGLVVGFGSLFGWRYWQDTQVARAENASTNYENFLAFVEQNDAELALSTGRALVAEFPGTPYASLTSLHMARIALRQGDTEAAEAHVGWVLENERRAPLKSVARLRDLRLKVELGRAGEAADAVPSLLESDELVALELAADIQAATGDPDGAIETYDRILALPGLDPEDRAVVELKVDAVGR